MLSMIRSMSPNPAAALVFGKVGGIGAEAPDEFETKTKTHPDAGQECELLLGQPERRPTDFIDHKEFAAVHTVALGAGDVQQEPGALAAADVVRATLQLVRRAPIAFGIGVDEKRSRFVKAFLVGQNVLIVRPVGKLPITRSWIEIEGVELGGAVLENLQRHIGA
jgi:hypothetical protein